MIPMFTVMSMQILTDMMLPGILCLVTICFIVRYFPGLEAEVQQKMIAWIAGPLLNMLLVIGFAVALGLTFQILT